MVDALIRLSISHPSVITKVKHPTVSSWVVSHRASCHRELLIIVLTIHIERVGYLSIPGFIIGSIYNIEMHISVLWHEAEGQEAKKEHSMVKIALSFCAWTLALVFNVFSRKAVEVFPCPQASYKDSIKKYTQREKKMATVARGGMAVIKKLGWDLLVSLNKSVGV